MFYCVSKKKFTPLAGCEMKSMRTMFKTEMLIYQLKANLDEKILLVKGDLKRIFLLMQMNGTIE